MGVPRLVSADSDSGQLPDVVLYDLGTRFPAKPENGARPVGKGELVFRAADYDAKTDGSDALPGLQAMVDDVLGGPASGAITKTRTPKGVMQLDAGTYRLNGPLKIYGAMGVHLRGSGFGTKLAISGTGHNSVLDLNGVRHSLFENLYISGLTGSDQVVAAVKVDWDPAVSVGSTYGNTFRKIRVSDLRYVQGFGVGVQSSNLDVSQQAFYDCYAVGQWSSGETTLWQGGFVSGSGTSANVLDHAYFGCRSVYNRYGFWCNAVSMAVFSSSTSYSEVDYYQTGARPFVVDGFRSENSQRLFAQAGGSSAATQADLSNGLFTTGLLAADGYWIRHLYGGTLTLNNITAQYTAGKTPRIQLGAANNGLMTLHGVASQAPFADRFITSGVGTIVDVNGYVLSATNQNAASRALWTKQVGAFTQAQLPTFSDGLLAGGPVTFPTYSTSARPAASGFSDGATIFDTTLGRLISVRSGGWVDGTGASV